MSLAPRLLFAFLAINLVALTPVIPTQPARIVEQKHACCADMNMNGGAHCPVNSGSTMPNSAACCNGPAGCLMLYFGTGKTFFAQTQISRARFLDNERLIVRSQPPPVPPPRSALS